MAGRKILLIDTDLDHVASGGMTLGILRRRMEEVVDLPGRTVIKTGYVPEYLTDGFYVEEVVDLTTLSFIALQPLTRSRDTEEANAAWAEIGRRIDGGAVG